VNNNYYAKGDDPAFIQPDMIIKQAMETCDQLRQALHRIETAYKAAPNAANTAGDVNASLTNARRAEATMRESFTEVVGLVRRLQHAYRVVHRSWIGAQRDVQSAQHSGEIKMVRRLIIDSDEESVELMNKLSSLLQSRKGLERYALHEEIKALLRKFRD
jgi:hypothetical protein